MIIIARILAWSALTGGMGAALGLACFGRSPYSEFIVPTLFLASVGGIIGAIASSTREIVNARESHVSG